MMKYLDPKNDLTFKKVFGEHPELLISLLNALLPLEDDKKIVSLEYMTPQLVPRIPLMKDTIVDVRCKDEKGRQFIVEMQMNWTTGFMQRVLFNASKAYVKQLDKGEKYEILQPVYALNLIDDIYDSTDKYYHHYHIVETGNPASKIDGLEFVFVELEKFKARNITEKKLQVLWLRYLTEINENTDDIPQELLESPEICKALEYLQESAFSKEELEYYDKFWDKVRRERTLKDESLAKGEQIGLAKGEQIGLAKGEQIGLVKGEQIGLAKGEQITLYNTAVNCFRKDISIRDIEAITGLTNNILRKLKHIFDRYGDNTEKHFEDMKSIK